MTWLFVVVPLLTATGLIGALLMNEALGHRLLCGTHSDERCSAAQAQLTRDPSLTKENR